MKKSKRSGGFTLIEVLAALTISAIVVAIAVPSIRNTLERSREVADKQTLLQAYTNAAVEHSITKQDVEVTFKSEQFKQTEPGWKYVTFEDLPFVVNFDEFNVCLEENEDFTYYRVFSWTGDVCTLTSDENKPDEVTNEEYEDDDSLLAGGY